VTFFARPATKSAYLREFKCYDDDGTARKPRPFSHHGPAKGAAGRPSPLDCPTPDSSDPTEIANSRFMAGAEPDVRKLILGVVRKSRPVDERKRKCGKASWEKPLRRIWRLPHERILRGGLRTPIAPVGVFLFHAITCTPWSALRKLDAKV